jgi:pimeloyl-ACP methyl ester carboxylesterase
MKKISIKRTLKRLYNIIIVILIFIIAALLTVFIVHKYLSAKEYNMLKDAGYVNSVSAGDYNLNVCMYGKENGKHTIVGIAGMGSNDFAVSVKPFMDKFADENRIVVIDRAGYGMSDDTTEEQNIERIVSDYRTVLKNSSCTAPYILVAHSLGGDYATYWANAYPDEIEAVVYFDPSYILGDTTIIDNHPGEEVWWEESMSGADPIFRQMGLARVYMEITDVKPWVSATSTTCPNYMKAFWEHSVSTFAQNSEASCSVKNMKNTASILKANDIPKLYIDANYYTKESMTEYFGFLYNSGMTHFDTDINPENTAEMDRLWEIIGKANRETYIRFIKSYMEKLGNCQYANISGDHYIYAYKTDEVEQAVRSFFDSIE